MTNFFSSKFCHWTYSSRTLRIFTVFAVVIRPIASTLPHVDVLVELKALLAFLKKNV